MCDVTHDPHVGAVIDSVSCVASDITKLFHASTTNGQGQGECIPIVHNDELKNVSDVLRILPRDETSISTLQDSEFLGDSSTPYECPVITVSDVEFKSEDLEQSAPFMSSSMVEGTLFLPDIKGSSWYQFQTIARRGTIQRAQNSMGLACSQEQLLRKQGGCRQVHWFTTSTDSDGWNVLYGSHTLQNSSLVRG